MCQGGFFYMKKVDYIIVGFGIAGIAISEHLLRRKKSFIIFDQNTSGATRTAGGVVNPVVLKRFHAVWKAQEFLNYAEPFYHALQHRLGTSFLNETTIQRVFNNYEEQNQWIASSDQKNLAPYLEASIIQDAVANWNHIYGMGTVNGSFQIETNGLINSFQEFLKKHDSIRFGRFDYNELNFIEDQVYYQDVTANKIVFAEGIQALDNPYFPSNCLIPKKGEYITIKAPELKLSSILKASFFVIPQGNDCYKVGATFAHGDLSNECTEKGKIQLTQKMEELLKVPFEVIHQEAGMRPTVKDHRPLLGKSLEKDHVYFLNGLGSRGLLMAPLLAKQLIELCEEGISVPKDIGIHRFTS